MLWVMLLYFFFVFCCCFVLREGANSATCRQFNVMQYMAFRTSFWTVRFANFCVFIIVLYMRSSNQNKSWISCNQQALLAKCFSCSAIDECYFNGYNFAKLTIGLFNANWFDKFWSFVFPGSFKLGWEIWWSSICPPKNWSKFIHERRWQSSVARTKNTQVLWSHIF